MNNTFAAWSSSEVLIPPLRLPGQIYLEEIEVNEGEVDREQAEQDIVAEEGAKDGRRVMLAQRQSDEDYDRAQGYEGLEDARSYPSEELEVLGDAGDSRPENEEGEPRNDNNRDDHGDRAEHTEHLHQFQAL